MKQHAKLTNSQLCELLNISERSVYYARFVRRHGIPEWNRPIWANKKGHTPKISWAARVCKFADHEMQRDIIGLIERDGIKHARNVWKLVEMELAE